MENSGRMCLCNIKSVILSFYAHRLLCQFTVKQVTRARKKLNRRRLATDGAILQVTFSQRALATSESRNAQLWRTSPWYANPERYEDCEKRFTFSSLLKGPPDYMTQIYDISRCLWLKKHFLFSSVLDISIESLTFDNTTASGCLLFLPLRRIRSMQFLRRLILKGKAGSGKSLVIRAITTISAAKLGYHFFRLVAPTGVAALNIRR